MIWFEEVYVSTTKANDKGWHLALARQLGAHEGIQERIGFEYGEYSYFGSSSCSLVGPDFIKFLRCDKAHASYELHQWLLENLPIISRAYSDTEIYMLALQPWEIAGYIWKNGERRSESWNMLDECASLVRLLKEDYLA